MIWSVSETLQFIEPYLACQLVPPIALRHARTIANLLPEAMSAHYFECRLAARATHVDFATCAMAAKGGREMLVQQNMADDWTHLLSAHPGWGRIYKFFESWADSASPLYETVPLVWLGFDQINAIPHVPLPCLSICLDPDHLERDTLSQPSLCFDNEIYLQLIETILEDVFEGPISPQTRQHLMACFDFLPSGGRISYLSVMLSRQPVTLKVNGVVPTDQLLAYLTDIGWTGSPVAIDQLLTTFGLAMDTIRFDLTVGPLMSARLGLEFFTRGSTQTEAQRRRFLGQLVDERLCVPEKCDALLTWSGFSSEVYSHQSWPTRLTRSWYVKIVYQPNQPLEAKGYLGFMPGFFSLFTLT